MTYPRQTHYIAALLRRKSGIYRAMEPQDCLGLVQWYCNRGRCLTISEGNRLQSAVLVRLIHNEAQARVNYTDDGGPIALIEMCASRGRKYFHALMNLFYITFHKACTHMVWTRDKWKQSDAYRLVTLEDAFRHIHYG